MESLPFDFLIIFNAILRKMTNRIRFFQLIFISRQNWQTYRSFFSLRKLTKLKITNILARWGNSRLMILWLFYILYYVKWPVEFSFLINFDCQAKLTDLPQFFYLKKKKSWHNWTLQIWWHGEGFLRKNIDGCVNLAWRSKFIGKSNSAGHFT